ncbi:hypothetical protein [Flavobacterium denitrificans]|uniref:hypothetical protein n=1 Tax=Flavobacterium denitrificans TaxID=281361 RepID=UPI0004135C08|nr:hypothetical protein [Flavobacterium denitrificans]
MSKEKKNAVLRNAILIAAAEKLIDTHFSIDPEELRENISELFETYMLTPQSDSQNRRETAYQTLTAVREMADLMIDLNQNLEVWQKSV